MKQEHLTRLIEAVTPEQMRQVARLVLRLSGYAASRITDGVHDGGADLRLIAADGSLLPKVVAVTVEPGWQKKLRGDAEKARRKLGATELLFMSCRRIPEGTFRPLQVALHDELGVTVDRIDQQGIVDLVLDGGALGELLQVLDLVIEAGSPPREPMDRRRDAAYAYAFFSPDVRAFREVVREQSVLIALSHAGGSAKIADLCGDAARLLGLSVDEAPRFLADLDRLRKHGRLVGYNGSVALAANERATLEALRVLRADEEAALRGRIEAELGAAGVAVSQEMLTLVMRGLGALMLRHAGTPDAFDDLRAQLRTFRRELRAYGLPAGGAGDAVVQRLLEVARASPLGRSLATGSLYRTLSSLRRDALLSALDARSVSLVLDASVAIPMFCALFRGAVRQRFFVVAHDLYTRARRLEFVMQLPTVWLEEMAAHLLKARHYRGLVAARVEDLRLSDNAYVAYFLNERRERGRGDFDKFLASLGLTWEVERRAGGDVDAARRQVEQFLRRQLDHYGIAVIETPVQGAYVGAIEREWDWARHEMQASHRDPVLERHDKQVLTWLAWQAAEDPGHAPLVVTWDRLLRRVRSEGAPGGSLDPLAVSELLGFMHDEAPTGETAQFAGLWLGEAEAEQGAQILDALVRIEREALSDAELVQTAQEFRSHYLAQRADVTDMEELEAAWRRFRETRR